MKIYRTFEEYMYDNYYDDIYNKVKGFLCQKKELRFWQCTLSQTLADLSWMIIMLWV